MRAGLLSNGGAITTQNKSVRVDIVLEISCVRDSTRPLSHGGVVSRKNKTISIYIAKQHSHWDRDGTRVVHIRERNRYGLRVEDAGEVNSHDRSIHTGRGSR